MEITKKAIKRTLRDLKLSIEEIGMGDAKTFHSKIKQFLTSCEENEILKLFTSELFKVEINLDEIEIDDGNFWIEIRLPNNKNDNLAYVIQLLERFSKNENEMNNFGFKLYGNKQTIQNTLSIAKNIVYPSLLHFQNSLEDFIEDNIEKEEILIIDDTPDQFIPRFRPNNKPGGIFQNEK